MSKTFNAVTGEFVEDAPNSNVSENAGHPLPSMTGSAPLPADADVLGPEIPGSLGWRETTNDVNRLRLRPGKMVKQGSQWWVLVANENGEEGMHWEGAAE